MKQHELFRSIYESNLKSRAVNVMSCLITYMNTNDNTCFPSIKTIAKCCSISVNTVKRALDDLVSAGFVEKESRFIEAKNGAQTSNLYRLSAVFTAPEPSKEDVPVTDRSDVEFAIITFEDLENKCEPTAAPQEQTAAVSQERETVIDIVDRAVIELRRSINTISVSVKKAVPNTQLACVPP